MNQIGFIGAGNMATAIIGGIFKSNLCASISAFDLDENKLDNLKQYGVISKSSANELIKNLDYLLLAVKPQHITDVLSGIKADINHNIVIISIAAGITGDYITKVLGFHAKVVQVMPNTPLMLSCGATALSKSDYVSNEEFEYVKSIFDCAGMTRVISKDKMNEIIPINGSSPAFIYKFAECFTNYGKSVGIDEEVCLSLFAQALIGSAKMLTDSGLSIEELITMVSSKGGTTIVGLEALHAMKLEDAVQTACESCVKRAYELTLE
ncbi:MAG: pyrroline-5-carboxylate reductase [Oscillospiraceae bacterium]